MTTPVINEFKGDYAFLSNFHKCKFVWASVVWPTTEHAYQAAKATGSAKNEWIEKIIACDTPGKAKRLGKKVPLRKKWDDIKNEMMRRVCKQKFVQNPTLMRRLIETGDAVLIEGNHWKDNYWGACPPENPEGENWLGKILMEIREEYKLKTDRELIKLCEAETMEQLEDTKAVR